MIGTIILVAAGLILLLGAARARKRGRRNLRMVWLPFNQTITLGTLADNTVATNALQTLQQDFVVYGIRSTVTFSDGTAGEGPVEAGWCQSQLTGTQILANRDAAPTSQWDVLANEQSKRKVRVFGKSSGEANYNLNNGLDVWRKMFLRIPAGQAIADLWVLNRSGAALTTGQLVHFDGLIQGRWA